MRSATASVAFLEKRDTPEVHFPCRAASRRAWSMPSRCAVGFAEHRRTVTVSAWRHVRRRWQLASSREQGIGEAPRRRSIWDSAYADFGHRLFTEYEPETAGMGGLSLGMVTAQMHCSTLKPDLVRRDENRQKRIRWSPVRAPPAPRQSDFFRLHQSALPVLCSP
jgi:hypothetical protein